MERKELEAKIIKLYLQGFSLKEVATMFEFKSPNTIKNILVKHNIERRSVAGYKIPFNEEFFEQIDSEAKAYFLGFMMADGNVCERKDSLLLYSSAKDVESIKNYFYKNANIYLKRKYDEFQKIYVNTETATSK